MESIVEGNENVAFEMGCNEIQETRREETEDVSQTQDQNDKVTSRFKKMCSMKLVKRRLPILNWLPAYNMSFAINDLIAGLTVSLVTVPQSIAYADVAGLPLEYGLYSAIMGPFTYVLLGSVEQSCVGPAAVTALLTFPIANQGGPGLVALLSLLVGFLQLLAGLLNLGIFVEFISTPVISGFCSAAALIVVSTQIKGLFGLNFQGSSVVAVLKGFFANIRECNPWDTALGCSVIIVLLLMRKMTALKNVKSLKKVSLLRNRFVDGTIWYISSCRNAIVVILGCLAAYLLEAKGLKPFALTGNIQSGLPDFTLPPFSMNRTTENTTVVMSFTDLCSEFGSTLGLLPLIAILEQVAVAKAFANGRRTDSSQEMIALGAGTLLGSFISSMPVTASFGRSAVQSASGAKTPFTNVYAGVVVLLALGFLMPLLAYIPKTILSAVIITSVIFLVEYEELKPMWQGRRSELLPLGVTFFCCLFINMEYGILIGTGFHLLLLTYMSNRSRPSFVVQQEGADENTLNIIVKAKKDLYFPGVEKFHKVLTEAIKTGTEGKNFRLVVDLSNVTEIDYSGLKMFESVAHECRKRKQNGIYFRNASKRVVRSISCTLPLDSHNFL